MTTALVPRRRGLSLQRKGIVVQVLGPLASDLAEPVNLAHVARLTDDTAIFEHAEFATPRREHGYCTDDVSRALLVAAVRGADPLSAAIAERSLAFVRDAALPVDRFRSRMNYQRRWMDEGDSDDASGRALWGLGVAAATAPWPHVRLGSRAVFEKMSGFRSVHWHATAFAALGAAAIRDADLDAQGSAAPALLAAATLRLPRPSEKGDWRWPERRVSYAAALLPDALLATGAVDEGLALLSWLTDQTTIGGHFSPVPVDGLGAGDERPGFDQQPIEAQAAACAAWRAWTLTADVQWLELLVRTAAWFFGANDAELTMIDRSTQGGCDGLHADGRNENQGAESTLAFLHTMAVLSEAVECGAVELDSPTLTRLGLSQ